MVGYCKCENIDNKLINNNCDCDHLFKDLSSMHFKKNYVMSSTCSMLYKKCYSCLQYWYFIKKKYVTVYNVLKIKKKMLFSATLCSF